MEFLEPLRPLPLVRSQGGVEDEVTLSAYVTIALLEMSLPITVGTTLFPVKKCFWMQHNPGLLSETRAS